MKSLGLQDAHLRPAVFALYLSRSGNDELGSDVVAVFAVPAT
jgi:hypothetical protein